MDLISRQAAIEYFMINTNWHDEEGHSIDDWDEKRKLLEDYFNGVPSEQPEIIRCKDCKHWDKTWTNDWAKDYHYCFMIDGVRKSNFFCADAERRTDD